MIERVFWSIVGWLLGLPCLLAPVPRWQDRDAENVDPDPRRGGR